MTVAIIYATIPPPHKARLEAAGSLGKNYGHNLVAIEVADVQHDYQWPRGSGHGTHYLHKILYPGRDYWTLSYSSIRNVICHVLEDLHPHVVVLPGWRCKEALACLGWCLMRNVPRVVITESLPRNGIQEISKTWLKQIIAGRCQAGFAAGNPHIRYLVRLGLRQSQCFVGCAVVDNDFFASESQRWRERQPTKCDHPTLFSCLRFLPRKNILGVLKVLAQRAVEWNWVIAGYGPERPKIEQRIRECGLEKRVRLLGHIDYDQLPKFYSQADAYLQPSLFEPWGLAVNEAMACGLPVVVSRQCGCHEDLVRENENGFGFDAGEPESLGSALDRLLSSQHRWGRMGVISKAIIAQWGCGLYAQSLWRSCEKALVPISSWAGSRITDYVVRRFL